MKINWPAGKQIRGRNDQTVSEDTTLRGFDINATYFMKTRHGGVSDDSDETQVKNKPRQHSEQSCLHSLMTTKCIYNIKAVAASVKVSFFSQSEDPTEPGNIYLPDYWARFRRILYSIINI